MEKGGGVGAKQALRQKGKVVPMFGEDFSNAKLNNAA